MTKLGLADKYVGITGPATGEAFTVEAIEDGPRPFKAFLDTGLRRTTTGAKLFGAMKGAVDGGILVPHSDSRFPGYDYEAKELDPEVLHKYIHGGHVADYMRELEEDDEESYKKLFSTFLALDMDADSLEPMYEEAHAKIREDPSRKIKTRTPPTKEEKEALKKFKTQPKNYKQRKDTVKQKKAHMQKLFDEEHA